MEDLRIILAQSVCYMLSKAAEKLIAKEEGVSEKDVINKTIGINLKDLAILHSGYYTFDSFKRAIASEQDERVK